MAVLGGCGTDRDHDAGRGHLVRAVPIDIDEAQRVRIDESGVRLNDLDSVALKLVSGDVQLVLDDVLGAVEQVGHRDILFYRVRGAVDAALAESGKVKRRFAQRLTRDRAGVDAGATDHRLVLSNSRPLAELGGLDRGALPGRAGADDEEVVIVIGHFQSRRLRWQLTPYS